jgi:RNA polymerase sigma-70 factor (ECF subfamily)
VANNSGRLRPLNRESFVMSGYALPSHEHSLAAQFEGEKPAVSAAPAADFTSVFAEYAGYVLGLVRRLGVRDADVEDVAQEVFIVVHAQLAGFEGRSTLKTWICGICVRKVSEYRRRAHRRHEVMPVSLPERGVDADQHGRLERSEQAALLQRGLSQLDEKLLAVFVLYEVEELPMVEVARALGCPRFTAYTRLYAARRALRRFLEHAGEGQERP